MTSQQSMLQNRDASSGECLNNSISTEMGTEHSTCVNSQYNQSVIASAWQLFQNFAIYGKKWKWSFHVEHMLSLTSESNSKIIDSPWIWWP